MNFSHRLEGFRPDTSSTRAAALSIIVAGHVVLAVAVLSIGGAVIVDNAVPILVQLLPEPRAPQPLAPVRTVPLPPMRVPDIHIPAPPIDNLFMLKPEEKVEVREVVERAPVAVAPAPVAAPPVLPSAEPPRFDLAYLENPSPRYPPISRRTGEKGRVVLRVRVTSDGTVEALNVQQSSGFTRLDEAALEAVRRWRFAPARSGGQAVSGIALVPIDFQLTT